MEEGKKSHVSLQKELPLEPCGLSGQSSSIVCPLSLSQGRETVTRTHPFVETSQTMTKAHEGSAPGSAMRTRGPVSLTGVPWELLEINRECCSELEFKAGQIPLSGFMICSMTGEVSLLFILQIPAQLSPFLEGVLTTTTTPRHCLCVYSWLCCTPVRLDLLHGPPIAASATQKHLLPWLLPPLHSLCFTELWFISSLVSGSEIGVVCACLVELRSSA